MVKYSRAWQCSMNQTQTTISALLCVYVPTHWKWCTHGTHAQPAERSALTSHFEKRRENGSFDSNNVYDYINSILNCLE